MLTVSGYHVPRVKHVTSNVACYGNQKKMDTTSILYRLEIDIYIKMNTAFLTLTETPKFIKQYLSYLTTISNLRLLGGIILILP